MLKTYLREYFFKKNQATLEVHKEKPMGFQSNLNSAVAVETINWETKMKNLFCGTECVEMNIEIML